MSCADRVCSTLETPDDVDVVGRGGEVEAASFFLCISANSGRFRARTPVSLPSFLSIVANFQHALDAVLPFQKLSLA